MAPVVESTTTEVRPRRSPDLGSPLLAGKMTIEDFGAAVGRAPRSVRRWISLGLPVEGRGSLLLIDIQEARAWLAAGRRGGLDPPRQRARNK